MSFYERLCQQTEDDRNRFLSAPIITDALNGEFSLATYIGFLTQAYHHVRHTVPLLMAAGARLPLDQSWLLAALRNYIDEEIGHEEWILDDLEACGIARQAFMQNPPPMSSEVLVAYLYDLVNRNNPVGILGMILVLEGTSTAMAGQVANIVMDVLQLPKQAVTYLTTHGQLDQSHMRFFEQTVNRLQNETDQAAVIHGAKVVYHLYGDVYRSLPRSRRIAA